MRRAWIGLAICLGAGAVEAQYARVRVALPGYTVQLALDTIGRPDTVNASIGKTYSAVIAAFEQMKVPLDTKDSGRMVVGNLTLVRMRNLAGSQLSRWFNCGTGITGPNADNWRVYIAVAAILDRMGENKTRIRIGMAGGAQDIQGASKDPVPCATNGGLEENLLRIVRERASGP